MRRAMLTAGKAGPKGGIYMAMWFGGSDATPSAAIVAEIDLRDAANRRAVPANTSVSSQTTNGNNWSNGLATDGSTYDSYYYEDTLSRPLILQFVDNSPIVTALLYRGSTTFPTYAPKALRIYVADTNYGTTESAWPVVTRKVNATWASSTEGWTSTYPL